LGRALKALVEGINTGPVPGKAEILKRHDMLFLSDFNVALSDFEKRIFSKKK